MSLETGTWTLPQILSVLEGGNQNFLHALKHHVDRNDYHNKHKRGLASRNLMAMKEEDSQMHLFEYRYKYNTNVQRYKMKLASRVANACKTNGGAAFQSDSACSIIPERDINNGTSLATYLVHKNKTGSVRGIFKELSDHNHNSSSRTDYSSSSRNNYSSMKMIEKSRSLRSLRSMSKPLETTEELSSKNAPGDFFRRLFRDEKIQTQTHERPRQNSNNKLSLSQSRHNSRNKLVNDPHAHAQSGVAAARSSKIQTKLQVRFPVEEKYDTAPAPKRKSRVYAEDGHFKANSNNDRHEHEHQRQQQPQSQSSLNKDQFAWSYQRSSGKSKPLREESRWSYEKSSGKSKPLREESKWSYEKSSGKSRPITESRRLSIDSMINPLLMAEERTNPASRARVA